MRRSADDRDASRLSAGFLLAVTITFLVACMVPYRLASARTPPGSSFSGVVFNAFDQSYYRAAQRSAAEDLEDRNRFTSEPDAPGPVAWLYPMVGAVQRATSMPSVVAYHLPRVAAAAAFPAVLAWFLGLCFPGRRELVASGVVFTLFATGVLSIAPWIPTADRSPELLVVEANVLRSFTVFPHFAVAYVGLVLAYGSIAMAIRRRSARRIGVVALLAGVLIAVSHTFLTLPVAGVGVAVGVLVALRERNERKGWAVTLRLATAGAAFALPVLPVVLALRREQERLEAANGTAFPSLAFRPAWAWIYAFGIVSAFAAAGAAWTLRRPRRSTGAVLLLAITAVHLLLMHTAAPFLRRFSEGLLIGVGGLAAVGVSRLSPSEPTARAATFGLVGLVVVFGAVDSVRLVARTGDYVPDEVRELASRLSETDLVLSGHTFALRAPAVSNGTSYVARPVETLRYPEKIVARHRYAERPGDPSSLAMLRDAGITVVVRQAKDPTFAPTHVGPPEETCLIPFFSRGGVDAYRVSAPCLDSRAPVGS